MGRSLLYLERIKEGMKKEFKFETVSCKILSQELKRGRDEKR